MEVSKSLTQLSLMATLAFLLFSGDQAHVMATTKQQPQWQGRVQAKVHGLTAKQVWPLFEDFCNIYRIFPVDVSYCVEGIPGHVGQRRYMASKLPSPSGDNTTFVRWEKHNLVAFSPTKRSLSYDMMENNQAIKRYRSTMTVLGEKYGSQIRWEYKIDPIQGITQEQARAQFKTILRQAVGNIEKILRST